MTSVLALAASHLRLSSPASPLCQPVTPPEGSLRRGRRVHRQRAGVFAVDVAAGVQLGSKSFSTTHTEQVFAEESTWEARYRGYAVLFGVGGGVRSWNALFAGVSYTRRSPIRRRVAVSAKVPHPFFFNQPRTVEGELEPLLNQQQAIPHQRDLRRSRRPAVRSGGFRRSVVLRHEARVRH